MGWLIAAGLSIEKEKKKSPEYKYSLGQVHPVTHHTQSEQK